MKERKFSFKTCVELCLLSYKSDYSIIGKKVNGAEVVYFTSKDDAEFLVALDNECMYVCFTGTEPDEFKDWIRDFTFGKTKVFHGKIHKGFNDFFKKIEERLFISIKHWKENRRLVFCGHSLGGAVAIIAAYYMSLNGYDDITCVTFGQPRVGNARFAKYCRENFDLYRIVIDADIVPKVPPAFLGFKHFGKLIYLQTKPRFLSRKWFKKMGKYYFLDYLFWVVSGFGLIIRYISFYTLNSFIYHKMKNYKRFLKILRKDLLEN